MGASFAAHPRDPEPVGNSEHIVCSFIAGDDALYGKGGVLNGPELEIDRASRKVTFPKSTVGGGSQMPPYDLEFELKESVVPEQSYQLIVSKKTPLYPEGAYTIAIDRRTGVFTTTNKTLGSAVQSAGVCSNVKMKF
jgi:hypothetical protein